MLELRFVDETVQVDESPGLRRYWEGIPRRFLASSFPCALISAARVTSFVHGRPGRGESRPVHEPIPEDRSQRRGNQEEVSKLFQIVLERWRNRLWLIPLDTIVREFQVRQEYGWARPLIVRRRI